METLTLKKMKKGMSFEECIVAIADGTIGLVFMLPEVCETASKILKSNRALYGFLAMLDAMEIYGDDLATLFARFCKDNHIKLITIIWTFEVGVNLHKLGKSVPEFATLKKIKEIISDVKSGKDTSFPFDEARLFIENNSQIRF